MTKRLLPIAWFLFVSVSFSGAQNILDQFDLDTPLWIIYEKGLASFDQREYGDALILFREAISRDSQQIFPEAEFAIGLVYEEEGELALAEEQYLRALNHRDRLSIPDMVYEIRYRLCRLYYLSGREQLFYEDNYAILMESSLYGDPQSIEELHHQMKNTFLQNGLDYLLVLYRPEITFEREALKNLAFYNLEKQRYESASFQLMLLSSALLSIAIEQYREDFPDYQFEKEESDESASSRINAFIRKTHLRPSLKDFLRRSDFYQAVYYWGLSLYSESLAPELDGETSSLLNQRAQEIWFLIADLGDEEAGIWGRKALRQLEKPHREGQVIDLY